MTPSAPMEAACLATSRVTSTLVDTAPMMTGTRPATSFMANSAKALRSSRVSAENSPVAPRGSRPCTPDSMSQLMCLAQAA